MNSAYDLLRAAARRALDDFPYFCANCFCIRDKRGRVRLLALNSSQWRMWEAIKRQTDVGRPVRLVVLKPRQIGVSTFFAAYVLWRLLREGLNAIQIAHTDEAATRIYDIVRFAVDRLPGWFRQIAGVKVEHNTASGLSFAHTWSQLGVCTAGGKEPGRSGTIQIVHCSEVAFWSDPDTVMASLFPAVPDEPGTVVAMESTGNGPLGYFKEKYDGAKNGKNDYEALFFPWYEHNEYRMPVPPGAVVTCPEELRELYDVGKITDEQLYWRQHVLTGEYGGREEIFRREYPATEMDAWTAESANFFPVTEVVMRLREVEQVPYEEGDVMPHARAGAVFLPGPGGPLRVFKHPEPGRVYAVGADAASGVASLQWADFSSADVVDIGTGEQVAHLHIICEPQEFARRLYLLGQLYNGALIAVETTDGHGLTVVNWLRDAGYTSLYKRRVYDRLAEQWVDRLGWATTAKTKPYLLDTLRAAFVGGEVKINDPRTLTEMLAFVRDEKGKLGAVKGAHDDSVLSLAICVMAWRENRPALEALQTAPRKEEEPAPEASPLEGIRLARRMPEKYVDPLLGVYY
ncbi:MAG: hypothetical protein ACUVRO_11090 [Armatimonadota bacterium]